MKKTYLLIVAIIFISLWLTGCSQTWVCECKSASNPSLNNNITYTIDSKKEAKANCENVQTGNRVGTPDYTCFLK